MNHENLGPAERIIQSVLAYTDHMVHNRPGFVTQDGRTTVGARWVPATWKEEGGQKVVYERQKAGKKENLVRKGVLQPDGSVSEGGRKVGEYRPPGLFPEVATWMYRQVAEVWKADNEFAAKWASHSFANEKSRDLKVVLAAFMLVQSRKGDPVVVDGKQAFLDEDFRDVGEAMLLLGKEDGKSGKDGEEMKAKLLLRVHEVLQVPAIAQINRDLGFERSTRYPTVGRWIKAVHKWLEYREQNPKMLKGLVKAGLVTTVQELARRSRYKPLTPDFFKALRWKQHQAKAGHREHAIGEAVAKSVTWDGMTEKEVCERVLREKVSYKVLCGVVPKDVGLTAAVVAAAIQAGSFSDKDLVIATPTLEELGLLKDPDVKRRWEAALKRSEDMRAANLAQRVKSKEAQDALKDAADTALKKAAEEVTKNVRVYFIVDRSGSMEGAIEAAKVHVARFLQGFPPDRLHVSHFNTVGSEVTIRHASAAGVENAFKGVSATGGTNYGEGVRALSHHKPKDDEDSLFIFIGDEEQNGTFDQYVRQSGLRPMAFGLIKVGKPHCSAVRDTAARLGIPCFMIDEATFRDTYAIPRTIRALVAATPVGHTAERAAPRVSLADQILKTELLKKPAWAA